MKLSVEVSNTAAVTESVPCPGLVAGVDVGKSRLDASAGGGKVCPFSNDGAGIAALFGLAALVFAVLPLSRRTAA